MIAKKEELRKAEGFKKSKIYTGIGDYGQTKILHNANATKDCYIIEILGSIDELNSALGVSYAMSMGWSCQPIILEIQKDLFELGAQVADIEGYLLFLSDPHTRRTEKRMKCAPKPRIVKHDVKRIERLCDEYDSQLDPLTSFILPGGGMVSSSIHHARSICRRAERNFVAVFHNHPSDNNPYEHTMVYLNRLSDLLFILARFMAKETGKPEVKWEGRDSVK